MTYKRVVKSSRALIFICSRFATCLLSFVLFLFLHKRRQSVIPQYVYLFMWRLYIEFTYWPLYASNLRVSRFCGESNVIPCNRRPVTHAPEYPTIHLVQFGRCVKFLWTRWARVFKRVIYPKALTAIRPASRTSCSKSSNSTLRRETELTTLSYDIIVCNRSVCFGSASDIGYVKKGDIRAMQSIVRSANSDAIVSWIRRSVS